MSLASYLPSSKFAVMVGALAISGGLVVGAQYLTHKPLTGVLAADANAPAVQTSDWEQALRDVEAQSGVVAPQAPSADTVNTLLNAAQSENLTEKVGRSLLVNLSSQSAQGLGQDAPTQDQLIAQAAAQIAAETTANPYTSADITLAAQSKTALRAYGNAVMEALLSHPGASVSDTYLAVGQASDGQSQTPLSTLKGIGAQYQAIADALLGTAVPPTLKPLHLELVNDYASMAATYPDMETILTDPLRGIAGVQRYTSLTDEAKRVLTSIAGSLDKEGIIFTKDEPGGNWSAFLSP
jgi:hypothetical protein